MISPFQKFALAGPPASMQAALLTAGEIQRTAASQPAAASIALAAAQLNDLVPAAKTLTARRQVIARSLLMLGVDRATMAASWAGFLPADHAAQLSIGPVEPGVCTALLVVPESVAPHPKASPTARKTLEKVLASAPASAESKSSATKELSLGERAVAETADARQRVDAEKAERFSRNWGAGRDARLEALLSTYEAMPAGADRLKFYGENQSELWAAFTARARASRHISPKK